MNQDHLTSLKKQYIAAMSREMKAPLQQILCATSDIGASSDKAAQIKEAAQYLMSLVEELSEFSRNAQKVPGTFC